MNSPIQSYLAELHGRYAGVESGDVATYIPELAKANPSWFGIAIATTDGHVYEIGDTRQPFTIQSISKAFTYGLALEDRGEATVMRKIGVEPSGDAFNSISLSPDTGRPLNPMINAGAIAATSLIAGSSDADKLARMLAVFSLYAGRSLTIDEAVFRSERETGHRNRAIGHMLRNFGILEADPGPALDLYFRQCSIAVECRDLAVMAATLANDGANPLTGERAIRSNLVGNVLSVMTTCGMYDFAGEWVHSVGLPAKSGVAGGILAVLPGQLGIGVFSPRLDARGNSVRGISVCRDLSNGLDLHFLKVARVSRASRRRVYCLADVSSKKMRTEAEREALDTLGERARVWELQGDVLVPGFEPVLRQIVEAAEGADYFIVDLGRVSLFDAAAIQLLLRFAPELAAADRTLLLSGTDAHPKVARAVAENLTAEGAERKLRLFPDLDAALEWCEDRLLDASDPERRASASRCELRDLALCRGLTDDEVAHLAGLAEAQSLERGALIVRRGDAADYLYLLMSGEVSVTIDLADGRVRRLSTLSPGMAFGELAILDRAPRTADVRANTPVECLRIPVAKFEELGDSHPRLKMVIVENLLRNAYRMVARLNQEMQNLSR